MNTLVGLTCCLAAIAASWWRLKVVHDPVGMVGVLGGLGPAASALLTQLIVSEGTRAGAELDHEHARFLLLQDPMLPNSRLAAIGRGPSPHRGMLRAFRAMARAGATKVCVCCNTAHPFARTAAAKASVPFLDMVQLAADEALKGSTASISRPLHIGLLGTDATIRSGLYQAALECAAERMFGSALCVKVVIPDDEGVAKVQGCILDIKHGTVKGIGRQIESEALKLVSSGAERIITGCTELPVCFNRESHPRFPVPIVSPTEILAKAIFQEGRPKTQSATARK